MSLYAHDAATAAKNLGYLNSYAKGISKAIKEHKMMMLVIVRDGCPWCKKLEKESLSNPTIKDKIHKYVKVVIDTNAKMPKYYKTPITPVVYFIEPKTQESTWEAFGFRKVKEFLRDIKNAEDNSL